MGTFTSKNRTALFWLAGILLVYFLVFHNLTRFPAPWFDSGSHLHVPKTLVKYGVYADISSEGFRYYGPTIGVGPTVMLPIAAAFKLFGIGLLQARLVMALYLLAAIYAFYRLVEHLGGKGWRGLRLPSCFPRAVCCSCNTGGSCWEKCRGSFSSSLPCIGGSPAGTKTTGNASR